MEDKVKYEATNSAVKGRLNESVILFISKRATNHINMKIKEFPCPDNLGLQGYDMGNFYLGQSTYF
jgi:hypothetical protein